MRSEPACLENIWRMRAGIGPRNHRRSGALGWTVDPPPIRMNPEDTCAMTRAGSKLPPNRLKPGDGRALPALVGAVLLLMPHASAGQEPPKTYYHVRQVTTGCQNPAAVRLLTNPDQTSQADERRLRSIRSSGHCVTITPRSQWSYLWRENDVAMMSYAGTIGRPGSYYLKVEDLVDANGQHPGGLDTDPGSAAGSASD